MPSGGAVVKFGSNFHQKPRLWGLEMKIKKVILLKELYTSYQWSSKKARGWLLEEFIHLTGYNCFYRSWLLRNCDRKAARSADLEKNKSCCLGNGSRHVV